MSAKSRKLDFRTTLIILLILIIIVAVLWVITNPPPEEEEIYSVERVFLTNQNFIKGKTITVEGIFYLDGNRGALIPPTTDQEPDPKYILHIDNNTLEPLNKYHIKGELQIEPSEDPLYPVGDYILYTQKIDPI